MHIKIDKVCDTILSQAHGLMFSRPKIVLFVFKKEKRIAIHTWFVFFPITLLFLDKSRQVTEIKTLKPWSAYRSKTKVQWLLEIPNNTKEFSIGQKIEYKMK